MLPGPAPALSPPDEAAPPDPAIQRCLPMLPKRVGAKSKSPNHIPGHGALLWAEPLEPRVLMAATNDPLFSKQYALTNAAVNSAWDITRGSAAVVVANIDSGTDYTHPDLYRNIWINQAEIPTGVRSKLIDADSDGVISFYDLNVVPNRASMTDVNRNGFIDAGDLLNPVTKGGWSDGINGKSNANDRYVDDIIGWDFAENDNNPFDDGTANSGHGTHTAGIMGAMGNNGVGISGVAQKVSMMIARIFNDNGSGTTFSRIAEAIRYTADNNAKASNNSWGTSYGYVGDPIYNAIQYAGTKGQLFVAAAGNSAGNLDSSTFNNFPAEYALDNIVAVSAITSSSSLASYSNYGAVQSDIAAPGSSVLSTLPGNRYGHMSGTSMATPMVTGSVALVLAADPTLTAAQLKLRLIEGADESLTLRDKTVSDGKLNLKNAMLNVAGIDVPDAAPVIASTNTSPSGTRIFNSPRNSWNSPKSLSHDSPKFWSVKKVG